MTEADFPESMLQPEATDRFATLRDDRVPRKFIVSSLQERVFEQALGQHVANEEQGLAGSRNADNHDEVKALGRIVKALRRGQVVERDPRTGEPMNEEIILSGAQVVDALGFNDAYKANQLPPELSVNVNAMTGFVEGLIADFPNAPIVEEAGGFRGILEKIARHGR